ncbi:MAG: hypothetical protein ABJZ55_20460 [Fuerstiella sp.]
MKHGILYFVSGVAAEDLSGLRRTALGDVVSDVVDPEDLAIAVIDQGPSGVRGTLFCVSPERGVAVEDFGFHVDRQTWKETAGGIWVGWHDDYKVNPVDLVRRSCPATDFQRVAFADGSHWEIPLLRDPIVEISGRQLLELDPSAHSTSLRTTHYRDESGAWKFDVEAQYSELFAASRNWWQWLVEATENGSVDFGFAEVFEYAIQVINLKYRYPQALHDATAGRLLDSGVVSEVLMVSCGWSHARQLLQKKSLRARL